jgi:hypothetical protein
VFGLEYERDGKRVYRFFALEVDRGTMPVTRTNGNQTSYLSKLDAYRQIIAAQDHRAQLGISTLLVLTVTTREARLLKYRGHSSAPAAVPNSCSNPFTNGRLPSRSSDCSVTRGCASVCRPLISQHQANSISAARTRKAQSGARRTFLRG